MGVCVGPPTSQADDSYFFDLASRSLVSLFELFILLAEAVGDALFVPFAGGAGGLFDQLPDVVLKDRDPVVEFRQ